MKLERVLLRNYRGVTEREVTLAPTGVTIVEGPNEIGKTAIAEAIQLAVDLPDSSKHRRVNSVQPVGKDEGPEVQFSMRTGQYELTFHKRWLKKPSTVLQVQAPNVESLTGQQAHERFKEILKDTMDEQLWAALRIEQGTELALPGFELPSLGQALDRATGGQASTSREETLQSQILAEYHKYWTQTGQIPSWRKTSERKVQDARDKVDHLKDQIEEIENDIILMNRLTNESIQLSETIDLCKVKEASLQQSWNEISRLKTQVERLEAILRASESTRNAVAKKWQDRQKLIHDLEESTTELKNLEAEAEAAAPILKAASERKRETAQALTEAEAEHQVAQTELSTSAGDRQHLHDLIELKDLSSRKERYDAAQEVLNQADAYLESAKVDDDMAQRIEESHIAYVQAESESRGASATVELTALRELSVQIGDETQQLEPNQPNHTLVEDELTLSIPDIARIRITAGSGSRDPAEKRRRAQEAYALLCQQADVDDVNGARSVAQGRRKAQSDKEQALKDIGHELQGETAETLLTRIGRITERTASYSAERSSESPIPTELDQAIKLETEARELLKSRNEQRLAWQADLQAADNVLREAETREAGRTAKIEVARNAKTNAETRLDAEREKESDDALQAGITEAQEQEDKDRKSLEDATALLSEADPETTETLLENATSATQRAAGALQGNRDKRHELRGSLDLRGEQGLQSEYDVAATVLEHLQQDHDSTEARAKAARLLFRTFKKHQDKAHQRYIEPFRDAINRLGRIVFGPTFEVEIDENLKVTQRILNGIPLPVDQLSTGAREQLGVITRLACAIIVSPEDGGAPVMIDDALGWSDPERLQTTCAAIAMAGRDCQVVVLTCTPGRYSHVGNARVVSL